MPRTIADLPADIQARYPYRSRFARVNGWRMHYIDEGPADGPPILLLHGNPAWGYLWRQTVPPLLDAGFRVVVPDQIGFGLSEKPHDHDVHTLDNHAANLVALLDHLDLRGVTFVCHDWGGPTGLAALVTRPQRAAAVAVMSTWAWATPSAEFHHRVMPWRLMHAPIVGPHLLGRQAAMPARGMYLSVVNRDQFEAEGMPGYIEVLGDPDERALTWIWPRSIPLGRPTDITDGRFAWLEEKVRALRLPATVIWGREDDVFTSDVFATHWHDVWPHAEGTHYVTGRHFLQEDSGAEIGSLVAEFALRVVRSKPGARMSAPPVPEAPTPKPPEPEVVVVEATSRRPSGHRRVPVLADHQLDHYPEFCHFLASTFRLDADPFGPPGLLRVGDRFYELTFVGHSGRPYPAGVQVAALVPGLEPLDDHQTDLDLWALIQWLVSGVGGEWDNAALATTGRIYRTPGATPPP